MNRNYEQNLWLDWLFASEQAVCEHKDMEVESYAGPETGGDSFYCHKCGWSLDVAYY